MACRLACLSSSNTSCRSLRFIIDKIVTCSSFRSDGSKLAGNAVSSGVEMGQTVTVASCSAKLLTSASQVTTDKTQPQVLTKFAASAVCVF
jgi:hypothetical protein